MQKNNIYILTFHCVTNYGAVLQAYAMQEFLSQFGCKVQIIDYRPDYLINGNKLINFYSLFSIIDSVLTFPFFLAKINAFRNFFKHFMHLTSQKYYSSGELPCLANSTIFLGSDQIWNPQITSGFDKVFFGSWENQKCSNIVSYAASFGKSQLNDIELAQLSNLLSRLSSISVREKEAHDLLKDKLNINTKVVLDPTLLAGRKILDSLLHHVPYKRYILIYNLNNNAELIKMAQYLSKKLDLKIIEIQGFRKFTLKTSKHTILRSQDPSDFISLIANSEFVVTDSFHGTAISLLYHKHFITYPHKTRGGRVENLLRIVNLCDRISASVDEHLITDNIEWNLVDDALLSERIESENFIKSIIL